MKILVINCGSSSLKYQLLDMSTEEVLVKGLVERIGIEGSVCTHQKVGQDKVVIKEEMKDHTKALEIVLNAVTDEKIGAVKSLEEIFAVGHRVVHGGEKFAESVVITDEVIKGIEDCIDLAPLHNPANVMGIKACKEILPTTPMVAVFDTAFHQTLPEENFLYSLPYELYEKYAVRKYGFHGTSHKYVAERTAKLMNRPLEELNIITCHLGNGASITAIKDGKSYDTSMGFTPLAGITMGTRCGDLDPAITMFLMQKENISIADVDKIYNKQSGVLGISGVSSDFRDLEQGMADGNHRCELALDIFANRVKKYIGSYFAILGRVDAIVFTAGLGENSGMMREMICKGLENLGIEIDSAKNDMRGKEALVSKDSSKVSVFVVPTNEELMIAIDTKNLTK